MKIFISHSSRDKNLVDQFIDKILILGCGINDVDIFCSSVDGLGIKTGDDFREHIKENLQNSDYSFLFISESYKKSDICLNEMGASWALDKVEVKPFIFPNIGFHSIGTLYSVKQVARIDQGADLDELFEEITTKYNIQRKTSRWNKYKQDFLDYMKIYKSEKSNLIQPPTSDFFGQFVNDNASLNHILLKCHPTLLDCKVIFSEEHYLDFFKKYCMSFSTLNNEQMEPLYPEKKYFRVTRSNTMEMLNGINNIAGGMVNLAQKNVFNYNVDFYRVDFLEDPESEAGLSYKVFCFVNDRWVFLPKPWMFLEAKLDN